MKIHGIYLAAALAAGAGSQAAVTPQPQPMSTPRSGAAADPFLVLTPAATQLPGAVPTPIGGIPNHALPFDQGVVNRMSDPVTPGLSGGLGGGMPEPGTVTASAGPQPSPQPSPLAASQAPQQGVPNSASLWLSSQQQLADITAREQAGALSANQAMSLRAEVKSIRSSYGLSSGAKLSRARRQALNLKLAAEADKISASKP